MERTDPQRAEGKKTKIKAIDTANPVKALQSVALGTSGSRGEDGFTMH